MLRGPAPAAALGRDLPHAAAGLLVEAALIDGAMDAGERRDVEAALARSFALPTPAAAALVDRALESARSAADFHGYSRAINRDLEPEARVRLLEELWRVVQSDGMVCDYEANLMRRVAGLLHIEDRDSGAARKRAAAS